MFVCMSQYVFVCECVCGQSHETNMLCWHRQLKEIIAVDNAFITPIWKSNNK